MIRKRIKKICNSKLDNWLSSICDKGVKETIRQNAIITGGSIASMIRSEPINDFDFYFRTREAVETIAEYYVNVFNKNKGYAASVIINNNRVSIAIPANLGIVGDTVSDEPDDESEDSKSSNKGLYEPLFLTPNAITLSDKVQIVIRFYGVPDEIHKNFDYVHCMNSWTSWDNELHFSLDAYEAAMQKRLWYRGSRYPLASLIRTRKFIRQGYHIGAGEYIKMVLQTSEYDWTNLNVLKDQLIGVDTSYMLALISELQKFKQSNPDSPIDKTYIVRLIDKIFN